MTTNLHTPLSEPELVQAMTPRKFTRGELETLVEYYRNRDRASRAKLYEIAMMDDRGNRSPESQLAARFLAEDIQQGVKM